MEVYILFEITQQNTFVDCHGESARDREEVVEVFDSYKKAECARKEYQEEADKYVSDLHCDQLTYEIGKYIVV